MNWNALALGIVAIIVLAIFVYVIYYIVDAQSRRLFSDEELYASAQKINVKTSANPMYKGTNFERRVVADERAERDSIWSKYLSIFYGKVKAPDVAAPEVGKCANLAGIAGDARLGVGYYKENQLYNANYTIGSQTYRGQFRYSKPLGGAACWKFMGNLTNNCGTWNIADKNSSCPFPTNECDTMKSYFANAGEGNYWTSSDGHSYLFNGGQITCESL